MWKISPIIPKSASVPLIVEWWKRPQRVPSVNSLNTECLENLRKKKVESECETVEALLAVTMSAAGWQQSSAVKPKLKLWFFFSFLSLSSSSWQMIRAPLWQISIWSFCLFHFQSSFFLQLYLFCICKVIKLNNVCASIGSTEKKPSRDLVSHTQKKKELVLVVSS